MLTIITNITVLIIIIIITIITVLNKQLFIFPNGSDRKRKIGR